MTTAGESAAPADVRLPLTSNEAVPSKEAATVADGAHDTIETVEEQTELSAEKELLGVAEQAADVTIAPGSLDVQKHDSPNQVARTSRSRAVHAWDIFLSYRVGADVEAVVRDLFSEFKDLHIKGLAGPRSVNSFWDKKCIKGGDWEHGPTGFRTALKQSAVFVPLISRQVLEGIKRAGPDHVDNVLLEYEIALALQAEGHVIIKPVFVHSYDEHGLMHKFGNAGEFDTTVFAQTKSATSEVSVRDTMAALFKEQGSFVDPQNASDMTHQSVCLVSVAQEVVDSRGLAPNPDWVPPPPRTTRPLPADAFLNAYAEDVSVARAAIRGDVSTVLRSMSRLASSEQSLVEFVEDVVGGNVHLHPKTKLVPRFGFVCAEKQYECAYTPDGTHLVSVGATGLLTIKLDADAAASLPSVPSVEHKKLITNGKKMGHPKRAPVDSSWLMTVATSKQFVGAGGLSNLALVFSLKDLLAQPQKTGAGSPIKPVCSFEHKGYVSCLRFYGKDRLLSSSGDSAVRLWDIETTKALGVLRGHTADATSVDVTVDGRVAATGGCDHRILLWDLRSGSRVATFTEQISSDVNAVSFHPSSYAIAGGTDSGDIFFCDIRSASMVQKFSCGAQANSVVVSENAVFVGTDNGLHRFDVLTGVHTNVRSGLGAGLSLHPDGRQLGVVGWAKPHISVWNV